MPQSYTCLNYHIVFSTKDRRPMISKEMQPRLYAYIGGILKTQSGVLLSAGGIDDHVHLLTGIDKQQPVTDAVRTIKTNSSKWVHETFPESKSFAWQTGYAAFTVSFSAIERVTQYLERQEEHHRQTSFQEELVALLDRHGVEYDAKYLWQ